MKKKTKQKGRAMKMKLERVLHVKLTRKPGLATRSKIDDAMFKMDAHRYVIYASDKVRAAIRADRDCEQLARRLASVQGVR